MCDLQKLCTTEKQEDMLIAVDGGGTKTEFVLITASGRLVKRLVLPGSNPNVCTVQGSVDVLRQGIDMLQKESNRVCAVYAGCSGFYSGGSGFAVQTLLREAYPHLKVACKSDICNVLACADDPDNAIAAISGTGSVVYAAQNGRLHRYGGGGWRLDPLGSGYELGRAALQAALEHRDGTGPETALTQAVEQKLGGRVWDYVQTIHGADSAFIASFAPLVVQAWQAADAMATQIIEKNTKRLAQLINMASENTPEAVQVVLAGSLLTACKPFADQVMAQLHPGLTPLVLRYPQIWGACLQSAALAELPTPNAEIFMDGYTQEG